VVFQVTVYHHRSFYLVAYYAEAAHMYNKTTAQQKTQYNKNTVVTLWTCYGALHIADLLLLFFKLDHQY